jgi:O-antigen ligase
VQRALSFLPGRWDPVAVADASNSTQWRLEMWKIMLTEDKYIDSKWLGDGFGLSKRQLAVMSAQRQFGDIGQEDFLTLGNVHSGPLSTIRYAGYVGLFIFMTLLITTARIAWRLTQRAKGSPYFALALFICIPLIYSPFSYVFVFGSFDSALPSAIYSLGLLKMLSNSLDAWEVESRQESEMRLKNRREQKSVELAGAPVPV